MAFPNFKTTAARSANMARIRSTDTKPEMLVRKALHKLGFRFRLHAPDLPGHPDIVLPKYQTVIQVKGCFWHGHNCPDGRLPKSNRDAAYSAAAAEFKREVLHTARISPRGI